MNGSTRTETRERFLPDETAVDSLSGGHRQPFEGRREGRRCKWAAGSVAAAVSASSYLFLRITWEPFFWVFVSLNSGSVVRPEKQLNTQQQVRFIIYLMVGF